MASNFDPIFWEGEIEVILNENSGKCSQKRATFVQKLMVEHFKDEIVKRFGRDTYDKLHKKYSLTAFEQKKAKAEREAKKLKKAEEKLRIQKERLKLKREELKIRKENTAIREDEKGLGEEITVYCLYCGKKILAGQACTPIEGKGYIHKACERQ